MIYDEVSELNKSDNTYKQFHFHTNNSQRNIGHAFDAHMEKMSSGLIKVSFYEPKSKATQILIINENSATKQIKKDIEKLFKNINYYHSCNNGNPFTMAVSIKNDIENKFSCTIREYYPGIIRDIFVNGDSVALKLLINNYPEHRNKIIEEVKNNLYNAIDHSIKFNHIDLLETIFEIDPSIKNYCDPDFGTILDAAKYISTYSINGINDGENIINFIIEQCPNSATKFLINETNIGSKEFNVIEQVGHECKITALSMVNDFLLPKNQFPLHKQHNPDVTTSIRKIAKEEGSIQGEILSINQLVKIAKRISLNANSIKPSTFEDYKDTVTTSIDQNKPLISFFAVNKDSGLPITQLTSIPGYSIEMFEHACVITGYNPDTDIVRITHWGRHYFTTLRDLYFSSRLLTKKRSKEKYYHYTPEEKNKQKITNPFGQTKKWEFIATVQEKKTQPDDANTGFQGGLIQFI